MNKILEIKNLSKSYYTTTGELFALDNISLQINDGDFITIVGSSGCGKSTFLNILSGLEDKTSGQILFYKENLKLGYMLQDDALLPWLTVYENALLGLKISKTDTKANKKYVDNLLDTYGLKEFKDKMPYELSGGMKQRVACFIKTQKKN